MINDSYTIARQVHTLLVSAHPHAGDTNLENAAKLATTAIEPNASGSIKLQQKTVLAIQTAGTTIESGASAANGEELLLDAVRAAEQWVRGASAGGS